MFDPKTRRGILNDFDLARLYRQDGEPSGKDNTGTMPFMALDLLNTEAFLGMVPRRYRHDAESFAWCLVYICICMKKDDDGDILVIRPHPLSSWFMDPSSCYQSKTDEETLRLLKDVPLHQRSKDLASALRHHWVTRFKNQSQATSLASVGPPAVPEDLPADLRAKSGGTFLEEEAYEEPLDLESFNKVYQLLISWSNAVPPSKRVVFFDMCRLVGRMYGL